MLHLVDGSESTITTTVIIICDFDFRLWGQSEKTREKDMQRRDTKRAF